VSEIRIGGRPIGTGHPCFVIAEAGVNHNGSVDLACRLIEEAAAAGVDAVKFQTFKADHLVTRDAPKAAYQLVTTSPEESQHSMLRRLELSAEAHTTLLSCCEDHKILFLSTSFDSESAALLARLQVSALKVPSGEITNLPLLEELAAYGLPVILSTGMATLGEVESALQTMRRHGDPAIVLLHCVSRYPAEAAEVNLTAMGTMARAFGVPVGYSDHTEGLAVPLAAVTLGACVIEKHFTVDRKMPGPDHQASIEPDDLAALVRGIRTVEAALGDGRKEPSATERETAAAIRKSLIVTRDVSAGTRLCAEDIAIKRPGTGLSPSLVPHVIGRTTRVSISAGSLLTLEMLV